MRTNDVLGDGCFVFNPPRKTEAKVILLSGVKKSKIQKYFLHKRWFYVRSPFKKTKNKNSFVPVCHYMLNERGQCIAHECSAICFLYN